MRGSLPRLMELWERREKDRDRFAILTIHETSRASKLREIEPHLARLEKDLWKKRLPFPVLVDSTGATLKKWGVGQFPTLVLIDPQGVVHYTQVGANPKFEKLLEAKLDEGDRSGPTSRPAAKPSPSPQKPAPPPRPDP